MTGRPPGVRIDALPAGEGPALGPFARELRTGEGDAVRFLPPMPSDDAGWLGWIERAAAGGPVPEALADRLAGRQAALGGGERAVANAKALAQPGTVAVVTGQQPGLFGGPLLTAHKVAGAINLARRLDGVGGHRVVPVFWSASEDHDFDEANRAAVVDRTGHVVTLKVDAPADGRSIVDLELPDGALASAHRALAEALPDTDRGQAAVAAVAPAEGDDFATASVRALLALFGDAGLVVVEPEQLWPASGETLAWLVEHASEIEASIRRSGTALRDASLLAPLEPEPGSVPVFYRDAPGGRRLRVSLDGTGQVALRGEASGFDAEALASTLRAEPARGSGDVAGRVFVQNRHLPVLAYIAGPTEIAYQAQVRQAALDQGLDFPLALPRPEATWVPPKAERSAEALGLTVPAVLTGAEPTPPSDADLLASLRALEAHIETLPIDGLAARGPKTEQAARHLSRRLAQTVEKGAASLRRAAEADAGIGRDRFERLRAVLRPTGRPQERVLSPWSLVARYGLDAVREGLASLDPLEPAHFLVRVGRQDQD